MKNQSKNPVVVGFLAFKKQLQLNLDKIKIDHLKKKGYSVTKVKK